MSQLTEILKDAGRNKLCLLAQQYAEQIYEEFEHLSAEIDVSEREKLICIPKDIIEHFLLLRASRVTQEVDDVLNGNTRKKAEQIKSSLERFDENEREKLEKKFCDSDTILSSPCVVFVLNSDMESIRDAEAYNLLPSNVLKETQRY